MSFCGVSNEYLNGLIETAKQQYPEPVDGISLVVGEETVMCSAAGWYLGALCVEWSKYGDDEGQWWPMPWDRYTDYMTEADAREYFASCQEVHYAGG